MWRYLVLVAVAFESTITGVQSQDPFGPSLIVGGSDATIEQYPYQAALLIDGTLTCDASIISDEWLLTAGHCVANTSEVYNARLGSSFVNSSGTVYSIGAITVHEDYELTSVNIPLNDIAAVRVTTPIHFDETRQPIPLFNAHEKAAPGMDEVITGWGKLLENSTDISNVLQAAIIPVVSKVECNTSFAQYGGIPDGQIRAGYSEGGINTCNGDSGGPLAISGRLAGITSWTVGCAEPGYPGVYTEVAWYRDWIKKNTGV